MNKVFKKIKNFIFIIISSVLLFFLIFFIVIMISDFKPKTVLKLENKCYNEFFIEASDTLSLLSWNIGYAGLGKNSDFFYDGGKMSRPDELDFMTYLKGILNTLKKYNSIDYVFLQEVDYNAKRSYKLNEAKRISEIFHNYCVTEAINYKVCYIPFPLSKPMGKVESGMITLSKFTPSLAQRNAYPQIASWPESLFLLDRCFIETRYTLSNGKELVLLNTHNSYYTKAGSLRMKELEVIKHKMISEYEKGNYVIAGGDWNQNPPLNVEINFLSNDKFKPSHIALNQEFLPKNWIFAFDLHYPTNRNVNQIYNHGQTPTTIIDYFIVSPNIDVLRTNCFYNQFQFSDHQPVLIEVVLN